MTPTARCCGGLRCAGRLRRSRFRPPATAPHTGTPKTTKLTFKTLGLKQPLLSGVRDAGYEQPTEIQSRAIPLVLSGKDLIGLGQTGSGKTAAFGLPILDRLCGGEPGLRAVVLVPTRELCVQVAESLREYGKHTGLHVCTAFGGIDISIQTAAFKRGLDVLVACPGRMIDHLERRHLTLEKVEMVVLDEADRMLDMGFMPQIRRIFVRMPRERQNLMFSATMPPEIEQLVRDFMPEAERVMVGNRSAAASTISHRFVAMPASAKEQALIDVLRGERGKALIFVNKKIGCDKLGNFLKRAGLPADALHGDKSVESRYVVLQSFARGRTRFLVATDVAARGLDIDDIDVVVNFDVPLTVEDYVHRSGRTARAGKKGRALTLVGKAEMGRHRAIVAHLKKTGSNGSDDNGSDDTGAAAAGRDGPARPRDRDAGSDRRAAATGPKGETSRRRRSRGPRKRGGPRLQVATR
jgi:ATP-dependent RNA helicase RhlE